MSDQKVKTSTQLWSHQVGMMDDGEQREWGYEWSNGRKFSDGKGPYCHCDHGHQGGGNPPPVQPTPPGPINTYCDTRQGQRAFGAVAASQIGGNPPSFDTVNSYGSTKSVGGSVGGILYGISSGGSAPSGDAVPVGNQIAPMTVMNTTGVEVTNQPFKIGHIFNLGALPASGAAISLHLPDGTSIPAQLNVKALHGDGSVRHAMVSGVVPSIPAGGAVLLSMHRAAAPATGQTVGMPGAMPSASVNIGGRVYYANASGVTPITWISGPVATDFVYNVPFVDSTGIKHPTMMAQFSVLAFATGHARADIAIEHCQAYTSTTDITYDAVVSFAGQTYTRTGLVHTPTARWKRTLWMGGSKSAVYVKHDRDYLIDSQQVPNYDRDQIVAEDYIAALYNELTTTSKYDPMGFGRFQPYMPNTGGRPDIGIMPDSYAALAVSGDKRLWDVVMASADVGSSWPMYRRDDTSSPGKGYPLSINNYPYSSLVGTVGDCTNPKTGKSEKLPDIVSTTQGVPDASHQPGLYYLPYLLSGDYFYLEGLHFACCFNLYGMNPWYRDFEQGHVRPEQLRGQGWCLRTLAECAAITPDDHYLKSHFIGWYNNNMKWYLDAYIDAPNPSYVNQLGIIVNGYSVSYNVGTGTTNGIAPWMDDHFTSSVGHGYELLRLDSTKRLMLYKSKFQLGRMLDPAVCSLNACIYSLGVRNTETSPWFTTLAECFAFSTTSESMFACDSPERVAMHPGCLPGDISGYPDSESGFPSNYQPALAYCVDIVGPSVLEAWTDFITRPTKPNYGRYGMQFAIKPRIA